MPRTPRVFLNVSERILKNMPNMGIGQAVVDHPPPLLRGDELHVPQLAHLMGHRGFRNAQDGGEVAVA